MQVLRDPLGRDDPPCGGIASIGNFDGVHIGHQAVLKHVVARAKSLGTPSIAMTFDPHPIRLLRPSEAPNLITTLDQRLELIERTGIEIAVVLPFTHKLARMQAAEFVEKVLSERFAVKEVYIGDNFRFGADRIGDVKLLASLGERLGFTAASAPVVENGGKPVSSTRIRSEIEAGEVEDLVALLGRVPSVDGKVLLGKRLGRKLGFPTLNIDIDNEVFPKRGVYITAAHIPSFNRTFQSVTNIGMRPTVYENSFLTVECHLLDFTADVYQERLRLFFLRRVRDEQIFPTTVQLMTQIRKDVELTRLYFLNHPIEDMPLVRRG